MPLKGYGDCSHSKPSEIYLDNIHSLGIIMWTIFELCIGLKKINGTFGIWACLFWLCTLLFSKAIRSKIHLLQKSILLLQLSINCSLISWCLNISWLPNWFVFLIVEGNLILSNQICHQCAHLVAQRLETVILLNNCITVFIVCVWVLSLHEAN